MKLYNFVIIMVGLMVLFNLAGMDLPSGGLVKATGLIPTNYTNVTDGSGGVQTIKGSNIYTSIIAIFALAAGTAIVAGLFSRSVPTSYLTATFVSLFAGLYLADLIAIYQKLVSYNVIWITAVATAIFAPLTIGFLITLVEWWGGTD